jgi:hypothetical protein
VKSASGFTPLHFAVAANCLPAVRSLLAYDARIDDFNMFDAGEFWISCSTKSTALHIAATSDRLHCAMAILQFYVSMTLRYLTFCVHYHGGKSSCFLSNSIVCCKETCEDE